MNHSKIFNQARKDGRTLSARKTPIQLMASAGKGIKGWTKPGDLEPQDYRPLNPLPHLAQRGLERTYRFAICLDHLPSNCIPEVNTRLTVITV